MAVQLISYSQPALHFLAKDINDAQDLIAFCARVSNPANQMNTETSEKLLKYLAKHKHWSPFEMVNALRSLEPDFVHLIKISFSPEESREFFEVLEVSSQFSTVQLKLKEEDRRAHV